MTYEPRVRSTVSYYSIKHSHCSRKKRGTGQRDQAPLRDYIYNWCCDTFSKDILTSIRLLSKRYSPQYVAIGPVASADAFISQKKLVFMSAALRSSGAFVSSGLHTEWRNKLRVRERAILTVRYVESASDTDITSCSITREAC